MANLGSEVQRFFSFQEAKDIARAKTSADRALKIIADIKAQDTGSAASEADIFQDIIIDALTAAPQYLITAEQLAGYFTPLATRVLSQ